MPKSRDKIRSSRSRVRVSPPKSKRCGSRGKGRGKYSKDQLVALAKASGVNPRQLVDDLCEELGIQPPMDSVEIPDKKCGSRPRGEDRYTREEVRVLAKYRKIKITGKTMDQLCDELGVTLNEEESKGVTVQPVSPPPYSSDGVKSRRKIIFLDEKIPDRELDTRGLEKVREWEREPDTLILYYGDDTMLADVNYSMFPVVNRLLRTPNAVMIGLNRENMEEVLTQLISKMSNYKRVRMLNADPEQNGMRYRLLPGQREEINGLLQKLQSVSFS